MHVILPNNPTSNLLRPTKGRPCPVPHPPTDLRPDLKLVTRSFTTLFGSLGLTSREPTKWPCGSTHKLRKLLTNLRTSVCIPTHVLTPILGIRKFVLPSTVRISSKLVRFAF